jgi:hypothetical protein
LRSTNSLESTYAATLIFTTEDSTRSCGISRLFPGSGPRPDFVLPISLAHNKLVALEARCRAYTASPAARLLGVELHLETALDPSAFAALLKRLDDPLIKVNYDTGNSSALGYRPKDELDAYGAATWMSSLTSTTRRPSRD